MEVDDESSVVSSRGRGGGRLHKQSVWGQNNSTQQQRRTMFDFLELIAIDLKKKPALLPQNSANITSGSKYNWPYNVIGELTTVQRSLYHADNCRVGFLGLASCEQIQICIATPFVLWNGKVEAMSRRGTLPRIPIWGNRRRGHVRVRSVDFEERRVPVEHVALQNGSSNVAYISLGSISLRLYRCRRWRSGSHSGGCSDVAKQQPDKSR